MTFRKTIAAISDSHFFILVWLLVITLLAAMSITAAAGGLLWPCAVCFAAAIAIMTIVVWMNEVAENVRQSPFG
jgi:hypothetical protein